MCSAISAASRSGSGWCRRRTAWSARRPRTRRTAPRHPAGLDGEQQVQEGHLGGGHREDPDRADLQQGAGDRESPCASYQAPAVIASHSAARGASHGASTGTSAASSSSLRSTARSSARRRIGRENRSRATLLSRPARRTCRPRRTAGRSRPRVRRPARTSARGCRRSTGRRARPEPRVSTSCVRIRPPTRSSASNTSGCRPASSTLRAAIIPDSPAPTTMTSASDLLGVPWWTPSARVRVMSRVFWDVRYHFGGPRR